MWSLHLNWNANILIDGSFKDFACLNVCLELCINRFLDFKEKTLQRLWCGVISILSLRRKRITYLAYAMLVCSVASSQYCNDQFPLNWDVSWLVGIFSKYCEYLCQNWGTLLIEPGGCPALTGPHWTRLPELVSSKHRTHDQSADTAAVLEQ